MSRQTTQPPAWADKLLQSRLSKEAYEEIGGDLHELFGQWLIEHGPMGAKARYLMTVFGFLRPLPKALKKKGVFGTASKPNVSIYMLQNYFKIAWRNLLHSKGYSLINIGGLASGMAIALLIGLWIWDEVSFNKYHQNYDSIAQVMMKGRFNGQGYSTSSLPRPLEGVLRNQYNGSFKELVMARYPEDHLLYAGEKEIAVVGRYMQPGAPRMLSLQMLRGSWSGLEDPSSILLSASTAKALFGNDDPTGKSIKIDNRLPVTVTGVYRDMPANSDFGDMKFIAPWDLVVASTDWIREAGDKWDNNSFLIYVQLPPNTSFEAVSHRIKTAMYDNQDEAGKRFNVELFLNPMSRWHLYSEWKDGVNVGGRIRFVWLFGIIGVFVLLLACINFMNLSTARSEKRAKEVGIRKSIGSLRGQLIGQFLSESLLVVCFSFLLSLLVVTLCLPYFNDIADKKMHMPWGQPLFWTSSLVFICFTGLVSGSYPAFYLSSFNPVKVLKGGFRAGRFATLPRKVLVVLQFTVSVSLIIGTIVVYRQINYAKDRPVGYDRQGLVTVQIRTSDLRDRFDILRSELVNQGVVTAMARASSPPTAVWNNSGSFEWRGKDANKVDGFGTFWVTHDYGKTVGWQFKEGRDFSPSFATDSLSPQSPSGLVYSAVINEAAEKYMGFQSALGEIIHWQDKNFKVIGVTKNMVVESPFKPVRHMIYFVNYPMAENWLNLRINPKMSAADALARMQAAFKKIVPAVPFDYKFADTEYGLKFAAEERIGRLASIFATLAILISCLGLFGLASFVAEKRTKEIGVRKVLGATVYELWRLLSTDFVLLVVIACSIAMPVSYYFLHQWLQGYEYRTTIQWWVFAAALLGALSVTLLTVSVQAIKAALTNPIKSLRTE